MRIPLSWLEEFVEVDLPVEELAERLTLAGIEVAAVEYVGRRPPARREGADEGAALDWEGIAVGRVLEVRPHPDADRLAVAVVDCGRGPIESVTGAPNLPIGSRNQRVAVAVPGARLVNAYGTEPPVVTVEPAVIRGQRSEAVICSEKELGLSDDHTGVLLLDEDAPLGAPLAEVAGDVVLELDLTPNLSRCLSVIGVAREVAALTGGALNIDEPAWQDEGDPIAGQVEIEIEDPDLCARYSAALIRGVSVRPAPFWMRRRLVLAGMRPINVIVDVTNYVMLEWGQPLHAFDYAKLRPKASGGPPTIVVRRARPGERLTTLDEVERALDEDMLLITDGGGPVAIAGVMGGLDSEVTERTRDVLLESANFDYLNNRRTTRKLKLFSEAANRFGKGLPAELTAIALRRAAELMRRLAGGVIAQGVADAYVRPQPTRVVALPEGEVPRLLGMDLSPERVIEALERLDFRCSRERREGLIRVRVPYHRLDVTIPADLVEEVARVVGYDRIPTTRLRDELPPQRRNADLEGERRVKALLVGCGLQEVITYSLTNPESLARLSPTAGLSPQGAPGEVEEEKKEEGKEEYVRLANPLSRERAVLRRTLLAGLLETAAANRRRRERLALFEVGRVYLPQEGEELPCEPRRLGILLAGPRWSPSWLSAPRQIVRSGEVSFDFFDLKGILQALAQGLNIEFQVVPTSHETFHPGRRAALEARGTPLGVFGEVHPRVAEAFDLEGEGRICLAELDLEALLSVVPEGSVYRPLPRFPAVVRDLAVVVDETLPAQEVESLIREAGRPLLEGITLFDVYRGEPIPPGQRSLAYTLTYQAPDRTLTDEEVAAVHRRIQEALKARLGARVRGLEAES